jgi:hypothetical protein
MEREKFQGGYLSKGCVPINIGFELEKHNTAWRGANQLIAKKL